MKHFLYRVMTMVLMWELICMPVWAQNYGRQFERPLFENSSSGDSFKKKDQLNLQQGEMDEMSTESVRAKGMLMTEPSLSGLTYQVHILGEVKKPGTYRIAASDRLSEVIQKAGGVAEQGSERSIEIRRQGEATRKVDLLSFRQRGNLSDNPYLLDNDVVFVPIRKTMVQVVGAVMRPKEYELKKEVTLADVVKLAGGFSVGVATGSPIRVIRFINNDKEIIEVNADEIDMSAFYIQNGDVIFVPHMITEKNTFDYDLPKLPGDNIFYPSFEDRVFVLGGVQAPGAYSFNPYYSLPQYLSLASGTSKMATGKISILSSDGIRKNIKKRDRDSVVINPGDTIVVGERRIPPEAWAGLIMGIASFGLSTTATVLALTK